MTHPLFLVIGAILLLSAIGLAGFLGDAIYYQKKGEIMLCGGLLVFCSIAGFGFLIAAP